MAASDPDHDWNWITCACTRCGATATAVHTGERAGRCDPGVIGITHQRRAAEFSRMASVAWLAEPPRHVNCRSALTADRPEKNP